MNRLSCSRRRFLAAGAAAIAQAGTAFTEEPRPGNSYRTRAKPPSKEGRKPLAVVTTSYYPFSHSYHIAGRFLHGYPWQGKLHVPGHYVHSVAVEQVPDNDISRELSKTFGFRWTRSIADALTEDGKLAVDGVLLIGEHGQYPVNAKGQTLYPRYEMFEQIVAVFRKAGRSVPVFSDKHLSYSWAKARKMRQWARDEKVPLMAGSSVPVTWRRPELEPALDTPFAEGLVAAYGGTEIYGFHALEALQCMLERRKGGETGVKAVSAMQGEAVWQAGDAGQWSWELLEAALGRSRTLNPGDIRDHVGKIARLNTPLLPPRAFLVEYKDGTRGSVLLLNGHIQDFNFAGRLKSEKKPLSCLFLLPEPPGAKYFDALVHNIEKLLTDRRAPYPVERTLLVSGVLDFALDSLKDGGKHVETPELDVAYQAPADSGFARGPIAAE